jgi:hypothetical protein
MDHPFPAPSEVRPEGAPQPLLELVESLGALAQLMTRVELTDPAIDPAQALPGRVEAPPERP